MEQIKRNQSSVEWLQWALEHTILTHEQTMQTIGLFEQAKAMHKEEITTSMEIAFVDGCRFDKEDYISPFEDWNHYYNETFNNETV